MIKREINFSRKEPIEELDTLIEGYEQEIEEFETKLKELNDRQSQRLEGQVDFPEAVIDLYEHPCICQFRIQILKQKIENRNYEKILLTTEMNQSNE